MKKKVFKRWFWYASRNIENSYYWKDGCAKLVTVNYGWCVQWISLSLSLLSRYPARVLLFFHVIFRSAPWFSSLREPTISPAPRFWDSILILSSHSAHTCVHTLSSLCPQSFSTSNLHIFRLVINTVSSSIKIVKTKSIIKRPAWQDHPLNDSCSQWIS